MRRAPGLRAARAALLAAGVLAILAGFGLHPEPLGADRVAAHSGLASAHVDDAPHACPICLTHAPAYVAPAHVPLAGVAPLRFAPGAPPVLDADRLAGGPASGRSPPAAA